MNAETVDPLASRRIEAQLLDLIYGEPLAWLFMRQLWRGDAPQGIMVSPLDEAAAREVYAILLDEEEVKVGDEITVEWRPFGGRRRTEALKVTEDHVTAGRQILELMEALRGFIP